ncbi:MAG: transglutaminase domain-containing protein, partial [Phycisphaeraceae bacterium]|nr:transglutaminase domain-containing protein [Phycisphaeraceae bacterium]
VYCIITLGTILLFHLKASTERIQDANRQAAPAGVRVSRPKAVAGPGHRWHLRITTLSIGLVLTGLSVVAFVLIPRQPHLRGDFLEQTATSGAGLPNEMRLNGGKLDEGEMTSVLSMQVTEDDTRVAGSGHAWLLRGGVLNHYDQEQRTWQQFGQVAEGDRVKISLTDNPPPLLDVDGPLVTYEITQKASRSQSLLGVTPLQRITSPHVEEVVVDLEEQIIHSGAPINGPVTYRLHQPMDYAEDPRPAYRRTLGLNPASTRTPTFSPQSTHRQLRHITRQILRQAGVAVDRKGRARNPEAAARAFVDHLQSHCRYSLDNPIVPPGRDPVLYFLQDHRAGHCELFAGTLALMARSVGIPARVIVGYHVGEWNPVGQFYVARQRNAHAWTELFIPGLGWTPYDATPAEEVTAANAAVNDWWQPVRYTWEWLEFTWLHSVVGFNDQTRGQFQQQTTGTVIEAGERFTWIKQGIDWVKETWSTLANDRFIAGLVLVILVTIGLGLASLVRTLIVRRRRLVALQLARLPRPQRRRLARQLKFYLTMLDMLDRHGYHRPLWQSPFGFAQELARTEPRRMQPLVTLTEHFYEIRFGHRDLDAPRQRAISQALDDLQTQLLTRPSDNA